MLNLLLSLAALLLGILAWRIGRRGKRIDNHPICRKCTYDLTGLPPTSDHCPECGTDIRTKHATRIGNRTPRRWLVTTGITLALLSLPATGITGYLWWKDFDAIPWLPLSWLEDRYKHGDQHAEDEIKSRLAHGKLSPAQINRLLQDMTAWQDDPSVKIVWGDDAISTSEVYLYGVGCDPAVRSEFTLHRYRINAHWRPQLPRGTPFTVQVDFDTQPEFFLQDIEGVYASEPRIYLKLDDASIDLNIGEQGLLPWPAERPSIVASTNSPELWRHEINGRIQGTLVVESNVDYGLDSRGRIYRSLPVSVQVIAPGSSTITGVQNPTLDAQMTSAIHFSGTVHLQDGKIEVFELFPPYAIETTSPPENAVFDISFSQGEKTWHQDMLILKAGGRPLGSCMFSPKLQRNAVPEGMPRFQFHMPFGYSRGGYDSAEFHPTDLRPDLPLELVLTSSPELAAKYSIFDHVWQGQIRIPVPIVSK